MNMIYLHKLETAVQNWRTYFMNSTADVLYTVYFNAQPTLDAIISACGWGVWASELWSLVQSHTHATS